MNTKQIADGAYSDCIDSIDEQFKNQGITSSSVDDMLLDLLRRTIETITEDMAHNHNKAEILASAPLNGCLKDIVGGAIAEGYGLTLKRGE